jgi:twinkle protein
MKKFKEPLPTGERVAGDMPCPLDGCNSSDAVSIYAKTEGDKTVYDGHCFSCGGYIKPSLVEDYYDNDFTTYRRKRFVMTEQELKKRFEEIAALANSGWAERKLPTSVSEVYGVKTEKEDGDVVKRYYPIYNQNDELAVYHVRNVAVKEAKNLVRQMKKDGEEIPEDLKELAKGSPFFNIGIEKNDPKMKLFGQQLFNAGGKVLIITEGCEDTMAYYKVMSKNDQGYITPVVSITCGASAAAEQIKNNYEWVTSFEKVIIAFDNDEEGIKASKEVLRLLKPHQAYSIKFRHKDACDYLTNGDERELKGLFFKAEKYSPSGIVSLSQMWSAFEDETARDMIPFPPAFGDLNSMMGGGMERGELTCVAALTSIGKSTVVAHIVHHLLEKTDLKVGALYLEGTQREVVRDLLSIDQKRNLKKERPNKEDMRALRQEFFSGIASEDRFMFVDSQGSLSTEDAFDKMRYLAKAHGCDVIIIDPIQAMIASDNNGVTIDFMDRLLKLAKETNCAFIDVSHMRKPDGKDPHDVSEYDILGSSSINQINFNTILLSRDKMADSELKRHATRVQLAKCRRTGETGEAGWFRYDADTTMIYHTSNPYVEGAENDEWEDLVKLHKDTVLVDSEVKSGFKRPKEEVNV